MAGALVFGLAGCGPAAEHPRAAKFAEIRLQDGLAAMQDGDYFNAGRHFQRALDYQPENASAAFNLGVVLWKTDKKEKAIEYLTQATMLAPGNPKPPQYLGMVLMEMGREPEARQSLTQALSLAPEDPWTLNALAMVSYQERETGNAQLLLQKALNAISNYPPALFNMAVLSRDRLDKPEDAIRYFESFLAAASTTNRQAFQAKVAIEQLRIPASIRVKETSKPLTRLPKATGQTSILKPTTPVKPVVSPLLEKARKAISHQVYDEALDTLTLLIRQEPSNADAYWELITLYRQNLKNTRKADEWQTKFRQLFPLDPRMASPNSATTTSGTGNPGEFWRLGKRCQESGDWEGAINNLQRALDINPHFAEAAYWQGLAYRSEGDREHAIKAFQHAIDINPDMVEGYYMMGVTYHEMKNQRMAMEMVNRVLKKRPDYAEANYLAGVLYHDAGKYADARTHYQKALDAAGGNANLIRQVRMKLEKIPNR